MKKSKKASICLSPTTRPKKTKKNVHEKKCKTAEKEEKNISGERTCVTRFPFALWALATVSSLFSAA